MSVLCAVLCCLFFIAFLLVFAPRPFPNVNSIIALDTASLPASFFLSFFVCLPTYLLQLHRTTLLFVVATRLHQCDGAKCSSTTLNFSGGGRGSVQDPLVTV